MPGDFSRKTFQPEKHYSGVLMQQGRVQLDADWNEQWDIDQHRLSVETIDVIGHTGVPKRGESFAIGIAADGADLVILPGRIYIDGLLFELGNGYCPTTYFHQPYYPSPSSKYFISSPPSEPPCSPPLEPQGHHHLSPPTESGALDLVAGTYIAYLDGWQREVNYLQDKHIQEVALGGGVDTATRMQNVWQVKLLKVTPEGNGTICCDSPFQEWRNLIAPGKPGLLQAQTNPAAPQTDPCCLPPSAGYLGLENQLYRVEVHTGGTAGKATFKWSREDASVETRITTIQDSTLTLADFGKDKTVLNIAPNQWVEIIDETTDLQGPPNVLARITELGTVPNTVILDTAFSEYNGMQHKRLRRWDMDPLSGGPQGLSTGPAGNFLTLENGIQVAFGNGQYNPGDYWLIPARVATANIEWPVYPETTIPLPRPPLGIKHHYCKLALITADDNGQVTIQDCRPLFPSLTGICADDICFNNSTCDLSGAHNVQEALDLLCAANDLRDHNKHLHGFGVVCGLTVNCGPDRRSVVLNTGYALDCQGNVIRLDKPITYPLMANVGKIAANLALKDKSSKVLLSLSGTSKNPVISVEPYTPASFLDEVLDGTLLKDFVQRYIVDLIKFAETELGIPLTPVAPVPVGQRKLTALINILAQYFNPDSGRYVFISGNAKAPRMDCTKLTDTATEDELLYCLFNDLRGEIAGKTFCGMFDGDRAFPDYKLAAGMSTIFGTPLKTHQRMQVSLDGKYAYTVGKNDNNVCIYDLGTGQLIQILTYTGDPNVRWVDIAVEPKFTHLFVVGMTGSDSLFAVVVPPSAANALHTWGWSKSVPNVTCVRLLCTVNSTPFGIFLGMGLYNLDGLGGASFQQKQVGGTLNATGLLAFNAERGALISVNAKGAAGTGFTSLAFVPLNATSGAAVRLHPFAGDGYNDDLVVSGKNFYATGTDPKEGRVIGILSLDAAGANTSPPALKKIPDTSVVMRLGVVPNETSILFLTCSDTCRVLPYVIQEGGFRPPRYRLPVQLAPSAIVCASVKAGYVLNATSNTITAMNFSKIYAGGTFGVLSSNPPNYTVEPPAILATYHQGVLNAYSDLLGHLLQYLKDSFCGEFLIDCPTCGENEKIYLGSVEIQDQQVYRICNFTKRKYVKTFRTVDWWLSAVPVLPLVKQLFADFCCTVINLKKTNP